VDEDKRYEYRRGSVVSCLNLKRPGARALDEDERLIKRLAFHVVCCTPFVLFHHSTTMNYDFSDDSSFDFESRVKKKAAKKSPGAAAAMNHQGGKCAV